MAMALHLPVGGLHTQRSLSTRTPARNLACLSAKEPGYCSPMILKAGGKRQLIVWHPNRSFPESKRAKFIGPSRRDSRRMTIATPRKLDDLLFLTCFYNVPWPCG